MKLFISYRSLDSAKVDTIVSRLRHMQPAQGIPQFDVWQDKYGIPDGHDWWEAILDAIEACDVFVFMLSRESAQNINCRAELNYARRRNRPILPIVLEDEYFYNSTTGKNDIDYWDDLPEQLHDIRAQFLFYEGTSFVARINRAIQLYQQEAQRWRDLPADRPRDPRLTADESNNSSVLYDEACDYAWRMEFSTARNLFQKLINNRSDFAEEAYQWIIILQDYENLVGYSKRKNLHYKLQENWNLYVEKFPLPFLDSFDPKHLYQYIEIQQENNGNHIATPMTSNTSLSDFLNTMIGLVDTDEITDTVAVPNDDKLLQSASDQIQTPIPIYSGYEFDPYAMREEKSYRLKSWNPIDWFRLLYWVLFSPEELAEHIEVYGKNSIASVGSWLTVSMVFIALLICVLPLIFNSELGIIFLQERNISPYVLLLVLIGLWLFSGIIGYSDDAIMSFSFAYGESLITSIMIAFGIGNSLGGLVTGTFASFVAFIVVGFIAGLTMFVVDNNVKKKKTSILNYFLVIVLIISYSILVINSISLTFSQSPI